MKESKLNVLTEFERRLAWKRRVEKFTSFLTGFLIGYVLALFVTFFMQCRIGG